MRTKSAGVRIREDLLETLKARAAELGYESFSAYMISLAIYDLIVRKDHPVTLQIMDLEPEHRDLFIDRLVEMQAKDIPGKRGSYFERVVEQVIEELGADGEEFVEKLRKKIKD